MIIDKLCLIAMRGAYHDDCSNRLTLSNHTVLRMIPDDVWVVVCFPFGLIRLPLYRVPFSEEHRIGRPAVYHVCYIINITTITIMEDFNERLNYFTQFPPELRASA